VSCTGASTRNRRTRSGWLVFRKQSDRHTLVASPSNGNEMTETGVFSDKIRIALPIAHDASLLIADFSFPIVEKPRIFKGERASQIYADATNNTRHWASKETTSSGTRIINDRSHEACSSRPLSRRAPFLAASV